VTGLPLRSVMNPSMKVEGGREGVRGGGVWQGVIAAIETVRPERATILWALDKMRKGTLL
jgi:hypothetical protein